MLCCGKYDMLHSPLPVCPAWPHNCIKYFLSYDYTILPFIPGKTSSGKKPKKARAQRRDYRVRNRFIIMCGLKLMPVHSDFAPILQPLFFANGSDFTRFEKAFQNSIISYYMSMESRFLPCFSRFDCISVV
jgi:hypothetical protein